MELFVALSWNTSLIELTSHISICKWLGKKTKILYHICFFFLYHIVFRIAFSKPLLGSVPPKNCSELSLFPSMFSAFSGKPALSFNGL